jgi:hypothetical protein
MLSITQRCFDCSFVMLREVSDKKVLSSLAGEAPESCPTSCVRGWLDFSSLGFISVSVRSCVKYATVRRLHLLMHTSQYLGQLGQRGGTALSGRGLLRAVTTKK